MSAKHTPGPWEAPHIDDDVSARQYWVCSDHGVVAMVDDEATYAEADTRLIAAAPELLDIARRIEALLMRQRWRRDGDAPESVLLRDARSAIYKAMGGAA